MSDQAQGLRKLIPIRPAAAAETARVLVFTSGKGGVGTSNIALNTAIALGREGRRVIAIDADLGLANLDLLCGLAPSFDLGAALAANRPLAEALVPGPAEIRLLAGVHGLRTGPAATTALEAAPARLAAGLIDLKRDADFIVIDAGGGLDLPESLIDAADEVIIVTTPEPAALANSHALLARIAGPRGENAETPILPTLRVVINQARSRGEAAEHLDRFRSTAREFLGLAVVPLGALEFDPRVPRAVRSRRPFTQAFRFGKAARGLNRIAAKLLDESAMSPPRRGRIIAPVAWRPRARSPAA